MNKALFLITAIVLISMPLSAQPNYPTEPLEGQLVYLDVENFLEAQSRLVADSDTVHVLQTYYFDKGSPGLKEFIQRHGLTSELIMGAMETDPYAYNQLPGLENELAGYQKKYTRELLRYKEVVADAMFPPTYLLIGANRGIGQASRPGQLITMVRNIGSENYFDRKLTTIIHELTHFQQARVIGFSEYSKMYQKENNMLDIILREGAAEFITYNLVRQNTDRYERLEYVEKREVELWKRFKEDLTKQDKSYWLWDSIDQDDTPILLGYTIGYKICESYYLNSDDKKQAINDILGIRNLEEFLEKSGYNPK